MITHGSPEDCVCVGPEVCASACIGEHPKSGSAPAPHTLHHPDIHAHSYEGKAGIAGTPQSGVQGPQHRHHEVPVMQDFPGGTSDLLIPDLRVEEWGDNRCTKLPGDSDACLSLRGWDLGDAGNLVSWKMTEFYQMIMEIHS